MPAEPRKVDRNRWRRDITRHLEDFPRQYAALEHAMAAFGGDFDLRQFKRAFNTLDDINAYNRVQAVERALGRVQNFVADLAVGGVKLARLPLAPDAHVPPSHGAFAALREALFAMMDRDGFDLDLEAIDRLNSPRAANRTSVRAFDLVLQQLARGGLDLGGHAQLEHAEQRL